MADKDPNVKVAGLSAKALREMKAELTTEMQKFNDENGDKWAAEHDETWDQMHANRVHIDAAIKRAEAFLHDTTPPPAAGVDFAGDPKAKPTQAAEDRKVMVRRGKLDWGKPQYAAQEPGRRGASEYAQAFGRYLTTGRAAAPLDMANDIGAGGVSQYAALQSDDAEQAGFLVASEQLASGILKDVDDLVFVRQHGTIHTVREAASLGIRKRTARMSTFDWSQELTVSTADTALKYGKKYLTPHHMTGEILVSRDLLRRTAGTAESEVQFEMARDAAETMEDGFLTGTGSQQPLGVFTASSDGISTGRDVSSGSTTSITADALRNAKYALKAQYRNMGPRWLFHRDGVKIISKLKDGNGQYLWSPGIAAGDPDRLLNMPLDESERSPSTFTTGLYVGLLAVWRYYEIADALDMEIQRLVELKAETNQVAFLGRLKCDGMPTLEEAFVRLITD